jgi:hypothetical protein
MLDRSHGFLGARWIVGRNGVPIQEERVPGRSLLLQHDLDSDQRRPGGHHVDEAGVRDLDTCLVVFSSQFHVVCPLWVLAHTDCPESFLDQQMETPTACRLQKGVDPASALRCESITLAGRTSCCFRTMALMAGALRRAGSDV